ncbi:MAG: FAD:protein FMN transferase [Massilibacteroides sp.]|nr:FAD:protein FMN transferase [Massilibacteroides sp.]MDD3061305.1 FAD:protein FMN transferase [Massilibacteroides sp.]MDD4116202.1 FAD:protein FMN transferase [Massilibacteroides sp.]MDD4659802.1 FAD:protein FMN transferase [Massilibacteroides sp.]
MTVSSTFTETAGLFYGSHIDIMGTKLEAVIVNSNKDKIAQCWKEIQEEVCRLDLLLNKFNPASELSSLNQKAKIRPVKVKEELWNILNDCREYYDKTNGYFDVSLLNYTHVVFDSREQTLFFKDKNTELDLGGYGKGYALEKIKQILLRSTISCALINFGNSSILAIGKHPYGDYWPIGIQNPYNPEKTLGIIQLNNNSMSTSGNMPNHPKHILNPHTQKYMEEAKLMVVQMNNAVDAEVLSTALMVVPPKNRDEIISHFNPETFLLFDDLFL